jgi:hypothetical protein
VRNQEFVAELFGVNIKHVLFIDGENETPEKITGKIKAIADLGSPPIYVYIHDLMHPKHQTPELLEFLKKLQCKIFGFERISLGITSALFEPLASTVTRIGCADNRSPDCFGVMFRTLSEKKKAASKIEFICGKEVFGKHQLINLPDVPEIHKHPKVTPPLKKNSTKTIYSQLTSPDETIVTFARGTLAKESSEEKLLQMVARQQKVILEQRKEIEQLREALKEANSSNKRQKVDTQSLPIFTMTPPVSQPIAAPQQSTNTTTNYNFMNSAPISTFPATMPAFNMPFVPNSSITDYPHLPTPTTMPTSVFQQYQTGYSPYRNATTLTPQLFNPTCISDRSYPQSLYPSTAPTIALPSLPNSFIYPGMR